MRTVAVVTTSRADYGIYRPVLRRIEGNPALKLHLIVSGMHLSEDFGMTVQAIEEDGFAIGDRVETLGASDSPRDIAESMGRATEAFGRLFGQFLPDILVVLGDRFEMYPAALAALPFRIPVAHIHGGELTFGAIDDALRHSMTKLSHLHFAATHQYARRIVQMGEEPWRVTVCGAPALDNMQQFTMMSPDEISETFGIRIPEGLLVVTYHPVTLEYEQAAPQCSNLLAALEASGRPVLLTMPNADTSGRAVRELIEQFVASHPSAQAVDSLGCRGYFSVMSHAAAMVGNSSSGIIEAASFELPVVNVGTRQAGRVRGCNVIDTGYQTREILAGIERAVDPAFRRGLEGMANPYGTGNAAELIVKRLRTVELDERLVVKRFHDAAAVDWEQ